MAKLDAYIFNRGTVAYISTSTHIWKTDQCVRINGTQSYLGDIFLCVPQGSILDPILYNSFFNDFFYFILLATVHNFADCNSLVCFGKTIQVLIGFLESESEAALNWFYENKIIVNLRKFQAIITVKREQDHINEIFKIGSKEIKVTSKVKLLGVEIDNELNFKQHINHICKSAANQLNILIGLKRFVVFPKVKVVVNSSVLSNFNYCALVWMFASS